MNAKQANYMRQNGLTHHDYYSPSRADVGVTAARWVGRGRRRGDEGRGAAAGHRGCGDALPTPHHLQRPRQWQRRFVTTLI